MRLVLWWFAVTTRRAHLAPRHQLSKALHNTTAPAEKLVKKICATNEVCTAFTPMVDAEIDFKEISIGSFTQAFKTLLLQVTISFEVLLAKDLIDATKNLTCFTRYRAVSRMYIWRRTINYLCSAGNRKTCSIYF